MPQRAKGPDAGSKDYIQLDALADAIGEDPGRFLDGPLPAKPRIQGLRTLEKVRAWRAAERKIARIRNRSPDEDILAELAERQEYLEEHGEHDPDIEPKKIETGPYPPEKWAGQSSPGASTITPHEENIARPAADGGEAE
ncbi:hypothetical protein ACKVMT_06980 [Halobacteriales archaeon Cl-PHB]